MSMRWMRGQLAGGALLLAAGCPAIPAPERVPPLTQEDCVALPESPFLLADVELVGEYDLMAPKFPVFVPLENTCEVAITVGAPGVQATLGPARNQVSQQMVLSSTTFTGLRIGGLSTGETSLVFDPEIPGRTEARLTLEGFDPPSVLTLDVVAIARSAEIEVAVAAPVEVPVGCERTLEIVVSNPGQVTLPVNAFELSVDTIFRIADDAPETPLEIEPGGEVVIPVVFAPAGVGPIQADLLIDSEAWSTPRMPRDERWTLRHTGTEAAACE